MTRKPEKDTAYFYANLEAVNAPIREVLTQDVVFHDVPLDWSVVLTDIKGSTKAVAAGKHHNVNLIATGSIIAVLNIAHRQGIEIPFFFGGDGATMVVPPSILSEVLESLYQYRERSLKAFGMDLRVGNVSVSRLQEEGEPLRLCKVRVSKILCIPVVIGDSLMCAERQIKGDTSQVTSKESKEDSLDLTGMECRWSSIEPPESKTEVVSLLVSACRGQAPAKVYTRVFSLIDRIYGPQSKRIPISVPKLRLNNTVEKIRTEMSLKLSDQSIVYLYGQWLLTMFGNIWFRFFGDGRRYLQNLVQLSDTLVLDGRINTVISGTANQRFELSQALEELEKQGWLVFGLHASEKSVMSCYVRDRNDQHIHFVDGGNGGYTKAAMMLKSK